MILEFWDSIEASSLDDDYEWFCYEEKSLTCNFCPFLNLTEFEQHELKSLRIYKNHYCLKYKKRVFHHSNQRVHNTTIYPCEECLNDRRGNYK